MIKRIPLTIALLGVCAFLHLQSFAQKKDSTEKKTLFLGPEFGMTLAMNTADYHVENTKRTVGLNFAVGAVFAYKFEGENSILGGLHFYSLAYSDENEYVSDKNQQQNIANKIITKGTFSYIGITAMLKASIVVIGFQLGIPVDGSAAIEAGSSTGRPAQITVAPTTISTTDKIRFLFEPRIGFEFPLISQYKGDFVLGITFGYPIAKMAESPFALPNYDDNFRTPSMKIHASYRFSLGRDAKDH